MRLLLDKKLSREVLSIGGPAIAGLSTQMVVSIVDTAMVGRLDRAHIVLAAMGLGMLATWAITSFFSSLSTGTHVLVARRYGEGNPVAAGEVLNNSLFICFVLGLFVGSVGFFSAHEVLDFFATDEAVAIAGTDYMRYRILGLPFFLLIVAYRGFFYGIGHTKIFLQSAIIVNLLNVILNTLLIYGTLGFPRMELAGAGLASTLSTIVGCIFFVAVSTMKSYRTEYRYFTHFVFSRSVIDQIVRISLPVSFQNVLILIGFMIFVAIAGIIGTIDQAASQVVITVLFISFLPCFGLGIATQTLVGQSLGGNQFRLAQVYGFEAAKLATLFTLFIGLLFIALPDWVLLIVTTDNTVISAARPILQVAGAAQVMYGAGIIFSNALQAGGATFFVMVVEVLTHWVVFLPCAYLFGVVWGGGIIGAWMALPLYIFLYTMANYLKFRSPRWMRAHL